MLKTDPHTFSFWIQYGCQYIQSSAAWRIPWAVQAVPAVILFAGMWAFPFSPRWLADKGRMEEARKVLADIHGEGDMNHPRVQLVKCNCLFIILRIEKDK